MMQRDWIGEVAGTGSENLPHTSSSILILGVLFSYFLYLYLSLLQGVITPSIVLIFYSYCKKLILNILILYNSNSILSFPSFRVY